MNFIYIKRGKSSNIFHVTLLTIIAGYSLCSIQTINEI